MMDERDKKEMEEKEKAKKEKEARKYCKLIFILLYIIYHINTISYKRKRISSSTSKYEFRKNGISLFKNRTSI